MEDFGKLTIPFKSFSKRDNGLGMFQNISKSEIEKKKKTTETDLKGFDLPTPCRGTCKR